MRATARARYRGGGGQGGLVCLRRSPPTSRRGPPCAPMGPGARRTGHDSCVHRARNLWVPGTVSRPLISAFAANRPRGHSSQAAQHDRSSWDFDSHVGSGQQRPQAQQVTEIRTLKIVTNAGGSPSPRPPGHPTQGHGRAPVVFDRRQRDREIASAHRVGTAAAEAGYRVRYTLASKLVNELVEAADDKQLSKTISRYGRVDLLCLDELGYMELDRRSDELLYMFSPSEKSAQRSRSPPTNRSPAGPRRSPSHASARPSSG